MSIEKFFPIQEPIPFDPNSKDTLVFNHYDPNEMVMGKKLADHLRFAVCYWHSFNWPGTDPFGGTTFNRPWFGDDSIKNAKLKADVAFEMFRLLNVPYFCFHDFDVRPEGKSFAESKKNLEIMTDYLQNKIASSSTRLLWGTTNLFSHRRYMAGAATNPDPEVFSYAIASVKVCMDATHKLGGENYVLWGGREGYETLLNTDLRKEEEQLARFIKLVIDYKEKIGFKGTILIEPKPQEPSKHQYDFDVATVAGFLERHRLHKHVKLNIESGHAFLAGHSFEHEIALATSLDLFGSIDMNRNDLQSGWDTDQFPIDLNEVVMVYYEILKAGGFTTGGTNFDAKLRRQSIDPVDLLIAHVGGMDICAKALKIAAKILEEGELEDFVTYRYRKWGEAVGFQILNGKLSAEDLTTFILENKIDPEPVSGKQEHLEKLISKYM